MTQDRANTLVLESFFGYLVGREVNGSGRWRACCDDIRQFVRAIRTHLAYSVLTVSLLVERIFPQSPFDFPHSGVLV